MKIKFLFIFYISFCAPQLLASKLQTTASIDKAVRHFIASSLPSETEYKATLSQFDSRLKIPFCKQALDIFIRNTSIKAGRNSIGIKCGAPKKWTLYNSVNISIYKDVVSLLQPIRRGEIFNESMLRLVTKDIATLRSDYFTDVKAIVTKEATRHLRLGSVVSKANITEPKLVKRGEKVFIKINTPNLEISTTGIAMMDGIKNQNIKIKNQKSKQIIQATVIKPGLVVVTY